MITSKEVDRVAHLAKLALSDEEKARYGKELDGILTYMTKMDALNLDGVEPTSRAVNVVNVFREDVAVVSDCNVFDSAPASEENLFTVPKII